MRIPIEAIFLREAEAPTLQGRLAAAVVGGVEPECGLSPGAAAQASSLVFRMAVMVRMGL